MEENALDQLANQPYPLGPEVEAFTCPKCGKGFGSDMALNMHNRRVHASAKTWSTKPKTKEQVLANRRAHQAKIRARNRAMGLTSAGKPRTRAIPGKLARKTTEEKLEYRRAYNRNWYRKRKMASQNRILAVYPEPGTGQEKEELSEEEAVLLSLLMKKYRTEERKQ